MSYQNIIVILGMHRSGTSFTTRCLNDSGLNIGSNLIGVKFSNKSGHYEDVDFHDLHEDIFKKLGIPHGGFENFEKLVHASKFINDFDNLIKKKINENETNWGWKDPRTILFLDIYKKILPDAKYIVVYRNYKEVIQSLVKRDVEEYERNIWDGKFPKLKHKYFVRIKRNKIIKEGRKKYIGATRFYYKVLNDFLRSNVGNGNVKSIDYNRLMDKYSELINDINQDWNMNLKHFDIKEIFSRHSLEQPICDVDDSVLDQLEFEILGLIR